MVKIFSPQEAILEIQKVQTTPQWVLQARANNQTLKALVTGQGFHDELIQRIEHLESSKRGIARKKYAKDIRDMFNRVNKKRFNVFEAVGGSEVIKIENETLQFQFKTILSSFKGNKSLEKYLSDTFFDLLDIDPNGLIFLEYKIIGTEKKIYPTYKSINDIRFYESEGQQPNYVIFEPIKKVENGIITETIRFVDAKNDYTFQKVETTYKLVEEKSFVHPFENVPAIILSDRQQIGSELRISPIEAVQELAKDYARDKSILTIYKFQNGFPIHWRYVSECRACKGTGKTGVPRPGEKPQACNMCGGDGILKRGDVTDVVNINTPKEGDPILTPNIAGYVNPSLEVWDQYNKDLQTMEQKIENTIWGTETSEQSNETATGRFIDIQPVTNELSKLSSNVEYVHNTLAKYVLKFITPIKSDKIYYYKSYGRRFIIETPDILLEKYNNAKEKGSPTTVLDRLLNEFIVSKYKNDILMLNLQLKKAELEPYVHYDIVTVNSIFGQKEALKKQLFQEWSKTADFSKEISTLATEFKTYINDSSL